MSAEAPIPDGLTGLPPGKIAAVVTYLQMFAPPQGFARKRAPFGYRLERLTARDTARYRALFRAVGEPWLWFSRLTWDDDTIAALLADRNVEAYALSGGGRDIAILELDFRQGRDAELAFLGIVPDRIGGGLGPYLMGEAIARAFLRGIARLWVHTCTLDHPGALGFYEKCGFAAYARQIEVADDPRLTGLIPNSAAPHIPLIDPDKGA